MNKALDHDGGGTATAADIDVDTGTIAWLLPEIVRAFDAATAALRQFRAGAAGVGRADVDMAPLRVARTQLHQAHGALEMGEVAGVTKLTDAIEGLVALFEDEPTRCDATALDAIIGGCRTIVEYLEDLQGGVPQQPLHLFPSYRDVLTARGVDRVHPADLFDPDLTIRPPRDETSAASGVPAREDLAEQRGVFEQALLRYIRNENDATALANLARAATAIDASVASTAAPSQGQQRAFWWVVRALFDALAHDGFAAATSQHAHIKRLAGRINLQIRKLVEGSGAVAERLFADTLFFVAIASPVTPHVRDVQARFRLGGTVPPDFDRQRYGRVDATVSKAARDALGAAKTTWAAVVGGDIHQIREFAKQTTVLLDAVGALKRRGLVDVAQVVDGIATDLGFDPRQPSAAVGLDVATALLFLENALERARLLDDAFDGRAALVVARVEAAATGQAHAAPVEWLDRLAREAEERLTVGSFVAELQANLRSAEKELDSFFRDPTQHGGLAEAQKALVQVGGALALLGHDDVHRVIDQARVAIARFQEHPEQRDPAAFETLAQNLGAVGFYVEQIKRDRIDAGAFQFDATTGRFTADFARRSSDLQAATEPAPTNDATPAFEPAAPASPVGEARDEAPAYDSMAFAATQVLDTGETLEEEIAHRAADAAAHAARLRAEPADRNVREHLAAALDDVRRNAALIDDRALQDDAGAVLATVRRAGHAPLPAQAVGEIADAVATLVAHAKRAVGIATPSLEMQEPEIAVPAEGNDEAVDAELLEIFLEEASGVLVEAESSLRVLDADPQNATATVNLRRGFHTLKGSGRMVGLNAFGEAGWAVEETMNNHIADQGPASHDLRALIDYAIRFLSGWVEELRANGRSSRSPDVLVEAARAVRAGKSPDRLPDVPEPQAAPAPVVRAPVPPVAAEDDFERTLFMPRRAEPVDDPAFAATMVLGSTPEEEVAFFGEQPRLPREEAAATHSEFGDLTFEPPMDFGPLPAAGERDAERATQVPGGSVPDATEPVAERHPFDAPDATDEMPSLDWLDVGDAPAPAAEAPAEAPFETSLIEAVQAYRAEMPAARADNVVAFTMRGQLPAGDDVRQIGPLTLSVALFNIYLSEADELLRVLTQDFAEWRYELDRFVSEGAMRAAHSLAGSSSTVGLVPAHDLAAAIEDVLVALYREPVVLREEQVAVLLAGVEALRKMLHRFAAERMPEPDAVRYAALIALRREIAAESDAASRTDAIGQADAPASAAAITTAILPFEPLDFGDGPVPAAVAASSIDGSSTAADAATTDASDPDDLSFVRFDDTADVDDAVRSTDAPVAAAPGPFDEVEMTAAPVDAFDADPTVEATSPEADWTAIDIEDFDAITTIAASETPRDRDASVTALGLADEATAADVADPFAIEHPFAMEADRASEATVASVDLASARSNDGPFDDHPFAFADETSGAAAHASPSAEPATPMIDEATPSAGAGTPSAEADMSFDEAPEASAEPAAALAFAGDDVAIVASTDDGFAGADHAVPAAEATPAVSTAEDPAASPLDEITLVAPERVAGFGAPAVDESLASVTPADEQDTRESPASHDADEGVHGSAPADDERSAGIARQGDALSGEAPPDAHRGADALAADEHRFATAPVVAVGGDHPFAEDFTGVADRSGDAHAATPFEAFAGETDEADEANEPEATDSANPAPTATVDFTDPTPSAADVVAVDEHAMSDDSAIAFTDAPPRSEAIAASDAEATAEKPSTGPGPIVAAPFLASDAEAPVAEPFADEPDDQQRVGADTAAQIVASDGTPPVEEAVFASDATAPVEEAVTASDATAPVEAHVAAPDAAPSTEEKVVASDIRLPIDASTPAPGAAEADALVAARRAISERESTVRDEIDPDLLDVFVEEASEILPQVGGLLRTWQAHRDNAAPARTLLRHLHTLKGSARMAGAMRLGEVVHDMETRVESAARLSEVPATLLDELVAAHDRCLELFDFLQHPERDAAPQAATAPVADGPADAVATTVPHAAALPLVGASSAEAAIQATPRGREGRQAGQQAVRVNADTLDRLVNLAGEVSISRARIENEVQQIKGAMSDLSDNVERLRSQLREIELQAEFQMQSRMQSSQSAGDAVDQLSEKFDPLEFDRFTRFQELTRMMAESVNDVKTVQQNLQKSLETAETDLTSQRRMTRDLQQDLMQVRLVPFSSIAERLYRVARRSAKEVDKRVNLDIRGGSVEIDRGVLERMAGPFEHLLRNHIVHGIESRDVRRERGKDETGELLVEVRQEGNEIVLTFSDDGGGLDHERIRAKGRELGLVGDEPISDAQAAELIFHPGFSTASEVTELAGRGVGMDVVRAEAIELAGRVGVDSTKGAGTRFTINLPLTLAVTQVVLVSVAGRTYALPAVLVEQVQQLRPQPLADAYRAGQLAWGGADVKLVFLGTLLGMDDTVPVAQRTSPVLILRSAGERVAVHVDEIVGNQEVVVKNLGPQLARMTGIAGATVLGSGEIVLILNPVQLAHAVRAESRQDVAPEGAQAGTVAAAPVQPPAAPAELHTLPTVMVVDDSLTVRRVTQRLLSREGYQVVLAKDGVDALEQLQDFPPDVMLVDIEMPRMDGFDLTRNVRNDERYRHIPIVMITSRTAEKHRRHAAELGVDAYLGKPYQEDELLELLATHARSRRGHPA